MKAQITKRKTKRGEILDYFAARIGQRIASAVLHQRFGTSFRTRVSEINRDEAPLIISNHTGREKDGSEFSVYWATPRSTAAQQAPFSGNGEGSSTPPECGADHSPSTPLSAPLPTATQGELFT